MFKRTLHLVIIVWGFGSGLSAYTADDFIRDRGGEACNGEGPECKGFYNEAIQLFDEEEPSPEILFD